MLLPLNLQQNMTGQWTLGTPACVAFQGGFYVNYYAGVLFLAVRYRPANWPSGKSVWKRYAGDELWSVRCHRTSGLETVEKDSFQNRQLVTGVCGELKHYNYHSKPDVYFDGDFKRYYFNCICLAFVFEEMNALSVPNYAWKVLFVVAAKYYAEYVTKLSTLIYRRTCLYANQMPDRGFVIFERITEVH